jgi:hypothetical protein
MDPKTVDALSRLAEELGPFFFAVLFVTLVTRSAHKFLAEACRRTDPPATIEEIKTYRMYFAGVTVSSILLVLVAIGWWMYYHTRGTYTYQIAITDIREKVTIDAPYFARHSVRLSSADHSTITDHFFLIVKNQPFQNGETFTFTVNILLPASAATGGTTGGLLSSGGALNQKSLDIIYRGRPQDAFRLEMGPGSQPKLVPARVAARTPFFSPWAAGVGAAIRGRYAAVEAGQSQ